eukprot:g33031.t1
MSLSQYDFSIADVGIKTITLTLTDFKGNTASATAKVTVESAGSTTTAAGGDTWFLNTTTVLAKGGNSVADNTATGAIGGAGFPTSIGDSGFIYAGGNGATGSGYGGGGGSSAGTASPFIGITATNATGATATVGGSGGNGGNGKSSTEGNGTTGSVPGGGGGGGYRTSSGTRTGGAGGNGQIIITYPSPEINIQANGISIADGDNSPTNTDATDFGDNYTGVGAVGIRTATISIVTNDSSENPYNFTIQVASLGSTTFSIRFNPSSTGAKTATVSIANNDATGSENPYTFTIKGTGIQTFFDSDGDGVYDNIDVDDDNDGIRDITEEVNCNNSNGQKVDYKFLNETFGTGARTTINTTYAATTSYSYQDATTPTNVEGSGSSLDLNDDTDGVADVFDLDADNDGIPDVIEAGLGNISNGKGKIDVTWVDGNGNGLLDSAEPTAAIQALDSDGDGIPNYIDLDSDNDSLFDVDESGAGNTNAVTGYVNGDGDINGDGKGDGPESETFRSKDTNGDNVTEGFGDGILDIYDYGTGSNQYGNLSQGIANANPATTYLKDTDSDGIPDYLDIISNGSTFDIANTLKIYDYKTLDTNNNGIIDGTTDVDHDGILDAFDTNTFYFGSPRDLHTKLFLDFDGRNDYGQSTAILGGLANASLMAWVDLNPTFSTDGVIVGQDRFQIRITSAKKLEAVVNGTILTFSTPVAPFSSVTLNTSQWYNVAATYDGTNIKLYLNGVLVATQAKTGAIPADASLLTLGKDPSTNTKFFKGKIDEVRVFNTALTDAQLQRMVYQEIKNFGSEIRGEIVPKNVATSPASLPFTSLLRYYRMDTYKDDIIDDLTTPATDITGTKIYNHKNIYVQQAPMPFITERAGNFATAVNSPSNEECL